MSDWKSEFKNSLRSLREINSYFEIELTDSRYSNFIPLSFAKRIKDAGTNSALWKQFVPSEAEERTEGLYDPIGDTNHSKEGQLIHRYKNRALFLPTTICPITCRYCFRKNELNEKDELFDADFEKTLTYLRVHPEIEEIIFSGGDPLILSNEKIRNYLQAFYNVGIKYIRFHTRTPIILPSRIDDDFEKLIKEFSTKFTQISIAVHVNHVEEFDQVVRESIRKLRKLPILLLSQTVLLKGVNDEKKLLISLFDEFINLGIRPYYLHHPDLVKGGMHFHLPLSKGRELYALLRDSLPGWAIPNYILDIPGGHGKTNAYNPESYSSTNKFIGKNGEIINLESTFPVV